MWLASKPSDLSFRFIILIFYKKIALVFIQPKLFFVFVNNIEANDSTSAKKITERSIHRLQVVYKPKALN